MKIAFISTIKSSPWGGSEELWYQIANEAINNGDEIGIFSFNWMKEPNQFKELRKRGVKHIFKRQIIKSIWRRVAEKYINFNDNLSILINPFHKLIKFNPEIVIVTDGGTYYTENDGWLNSTLVKYFPGRYVIICQSNSNYHLPNSRDNAIKIFDQALIVVFVSEHNRTLCEHQLSHRLSNAIIAQNPVILNNFNIRAFPKIEDYINCALVGRFCISDKGQDIIIALMGDTNWKNRNLKLHLYGNGEDKEYLIELSKFYGITEKVIIHDFTSDKNEIWNDCHCLLMCSHSEGTPLTLLEAMVYGRVPIVTKVGGNEEWIIDNQNGFLVDAPSKELFSQKLSEALSRVDEWESIAAQAHISCLSKLDKNPGKTLYLKIIGFKNQIIDIQNTKPKKSR
jgi:glycosyltransferase involved in cell wall biosynthesis